MNIPVTVYIVTRRHSDPCAVAELGVHGSLVDAHSHFDLVKADRLSRGATLHWEHPREWHHNGDTIHAAYVTSDDPSDTYREELRITKWEL